MKEKLFRRTLAAMLAALTIGTAVPITTVFAAASDEPTSIAGENQEQQDESSAITEESGDTAVNIQSIDDLEDGSPKDPLQTFELTYQAIEDSKMILNWTPEEGADFYTVWYDDDNDNKYDSFGDTSDTTKTVTLEQGHWYKIYVQSYKSTNEDERAEIGQSNQFEYVAPFLGRVTVSAAALSPTVIKVKSTQQSGATAYKYERATENKDSAFTEVFSGPQDYYYDYHAVPGVTYYYRVTPVTKYAGGQTSKVVSAVTADTPPTLTMTGASDNEVHLTWDRVEGANEYQIFRSTSRSGEYKQIGSTEYEDYTDTIEEGQTYYYKIRSVSKTYGGTITYTGKFTNIVNNKAAIGIPAVKASSPAYNRLRVSWSEVAGATKYQVYYATSKNGKFKKLKTVSSTTTSCTQKVYPGKTCYYKVRAIVGSKKGSFSSVVKQKATIKTPTVTATPKANNKVKVVVKTVKNAGYYKIYRSTSKNSGYKKIATIKKANAKSYIDKVTANKKYYYKAAAYNKTYKLTSSKSTADVACPKLAATKSLTASISGKKVTLNWKKVPGATSYNVYQSTDGKNYTKLGNTTNLKYTTKGLKDGSYTFKLVAANKNGETPKFKTKTVTLGTVYKVVKTVDDQYETVEHITEEIKSRFTCNECGAEFEHATEADDHISDSIHNSILTWQKTGVRVPDEDICESYSSEEYVVEHKTYTKEFVGKGYSVKSPVSVNGHDPDPETDESVIYWTKKDGEKKYKVYYWGKTFFGNDWKFLETTTDTSTTIPVDISVDTQFKVVPVTE